MGFNILHWYLPSGINADSECISMTNKQFLRKEARCSQMYGVEHYDVEGLKLVLSLPERVQILHCIGSQCAWPHTHVCICI